MPQIDLDQLANEAQANLGLDPRYWDQDDGSFVFYGVTVYFEKQADWFILAVQQVEIVVARP